VLVVEIGRVMFVVCRVNKVVLGMKVCVWAEMRMARKEVGEVER